MIRDYPCTYLQSGIGQDLSVCDSHSFPEVHLQAEAMAALAVDIKEKTGAAWCALPFCHTVEAEALGAKIRYGDVHNGPRVAEYVYKYAEELLQSPPVDPTVGRMAQVIGACRILHEKGETVFLEITGPFTLLSSLIEPMVIFRILRKTPELAERLFEKLRADLLTYIEAAQGAGVQMFSYADPTGGVNILGPKLAEQMVKTFTLPMLQMLDRKLPKDVLIHLCPKTAFALIDTDLAEIYDYDLLDGLTYHQAVMAVRGKVRFAGQTCLKNKNFCPGPALQGLRLK
ncbi:MAG: methylcobamide--CoM methyltransferase [Clostridia bacterium]|nr:methylcobamide--CoM methyltransferase [Clostridia bacterium]